MNTGNRSTKVIRYSKLVFQDDSATKPLEGFVRTVGPKYFGEKLNKFRDRSCEPDSHTLNGKVGEKVGGMGGGARERHVRSAISNGKYPIIGCGHNP